MVKQVIKVYYLIVLVLSFLIVVMIIIVVNNVCLKSSVPDMQKHKGSVFARQLWQIMTPFSKHVGLEVEWIRI